MHVFFYLKWIALFLIVISFAKLVKIFAFIPDFKYFPEKRRYFSVINLGGNTLNVYN